MIYVGIDTGVETGFSEWDNRERKLLSVCSLKIHEAMDRVKNLAALHGKKSVSYTHLTLPTTSRV